MAQDGGYWRDKLRELTKCEVFVDVFIITAGQALQRALAIH